MSSLRASIRSSIDGRLSRGHDRDLGEERRSLVKVRIDFFFIIFIFFETFFFFFLSPFSHQHTNLGRRI